MTFNYNNMINVNKKINKLVKEVEEEKIDIVLTDEQKRLLIETWRNAPKNQPPSIKELTNVIFPNTDLDGRSLQGKAVKEFFASYNIAPSTNQHQLIGPHELTVAEKEFVQNNIDTMKPLEMCKTLWPMISNMSPLSKEFRAVKEYINKFEVKEINYDIQKITEEVFTPPKNYSECLRLINKYNHDILSINDISEKQKQGILTLIRYLHSPRFLKTISTFSDEENRMLFLSEFIRATYDKPDLSVDELNLYISLAASYPLEQIALAEREALSQKLQQETEDGKIFQATVEAINAKNDEYKECQIRQEKLIKELNGSRSKRLDKHRAANASVLSIIEYVREEKKRHRLLQLADMKKKALKTSIDELMTFDSIKAEIFGSVKFFSDEQK